MSDFYILKESNKDFFKNNNIKTYTKVRLFDYCIPLSFYSINTSNNKFYINDTITNILVTISEGSYISTNLLTELQTQLNSVSSGFTVSYSNTTKKYTISRTSNFSLLFGTFTAYNKICDVLGFQKIDYSASASYTAYNIYQSIPYNIIMVNIPELHLKKKIKIGDYRNSPNISDFYINIANYNFGEIASPAESFNNEYVTLENYDNKEYLNVEYYFIDYLGNATQINFNGGNPIIVLQFK